MRELEFEKQDVNLGQLDKAIRGAMAGFLGIVADGKKLRVLVDDDLKTDAEQKIKDIVEQFSATPEAPAEDRLTAFETRISALEAVVADLKKGKGN